MSLAKGTLFLTLSSIVFLISGYLTNIWLGRHLGPEFYGMYGVVISLMSIVNIIQMAGVPQAVSKFVAEDKDNADSVLKPALIVQLTSTLAISTALFVLSEPLATVMHDEKLTSYLQLSSLIFPMYGLYSLYVGYYNGLHNFKKQSLLSTIYPIAKVGTIIGLAMYFHLYGAIGGFILAPLIALVFAFHFPQKNHKLFSYKKLLLFSFPLIGFAVFSTLQSSVDLFFIKALMHDAKSAGYFTAAQNIARIPYFGLSAFATVLFPSISASVSQNDHVKTRKIINNALRYILILLIPATALISATSSQITSMLYSHEYVAAAVPLAIITFGYGFSTLFTIQANILSGSGTPKMAMIIAGIGAIFNSILCYLLIPRYGLAGASFATTVAGALTCTLATIGIYKKFHTLTELSSLIKIIASSGIVYFVSLYINLPTVFLPIKYAVVGLIYVGILFLLKEIKSDDTKRILDLLPKKKQSIPIVPEEEL